MDVKERALQAHEKWGGKIEVVARCEVNSKDDLSIAYTPGVADQGRSVSQLHLYAPPQSGCGHHGRHRGARSG